MRCKDSRQEPRSGYRGGINELSIEPASVCSVDLDSMTKAQLLEYAEANGIAGVGSSMLKADILAVIKEAEANV